MKRLIDFFKSIGKEQIIGIVRHVLTFIGGIVLVVGVTTESAVTEITGGLMTLVTIIFSWTAVDKKDALDRIAATIRHLFTVLAGIGAVKGWFSSEQFLTIVSSLLGLVGVIWSIKNKEPIPQITTTFPNTPQLPEPTNTTV